MVIQHFPGEIVGAIEHRVRSPRPQPGRNEHVEIAHYRCQALEVNLVVVLQQQRQVFPWREGIARQVKEGIERFGTADVQAVAL
ncbi:hypothetical protein D3C71_1887640 [compost metagenome]